MIKLIAIDLDDTLLTDDKKITESNKEALLYAREKGIKVVLCTGRPYLAMKDLVAEIGLTSEDDYIITYNGAQVRRAASGEVVVENILTKADAVAWYDRLMAIDLPLDVIDARYVIEPKVYPTNYPSFYSEKVSNLETQTIDFTDLADDHPINKMVICIDPEHLDRQLPLLDPCFTSKYSTFKSRTFLCEIVAKGVNKGNTLKRLGEELNIAPAEMMTIGDQENDLTMIQLAGIGVAMGNAVTAVKEAADYITADNNSSGVAQAIHHFLK